MLTFNTFDPHPVFQAQQMNTKDTDYSFRLEYVNKDGKREKIYNAVSYDSSTQIMSGKMCMADTTKNPKTDRQKMLYGVSEKNRYEE